MVHLFIIFTGIMPIRHQPSIPGNFKLISELDQGLLPSRNTVALWRNERRLVVLLSSTSYRGALVKTCQQEDPEILHKVNTKP